MTPDIPDEYTQVTVRVHADPERCYAVASDITSYPGWADGVASAEVLDHDADGRALAARFTAEAVGRRTEYTLDYDHAGAPEMIRWTQRSADSSRRLDGSYGFRSTGEFGPGGEPVTEVTYELAIDLVLPLPGFVKRRVETKIVHAALDGFRAEIARRA